MKLDLPAGVDVKSSCSKQEATGSGSSVFAALLSLVNGPRPIVVGTSQRKMTLGLVGRKVGMTRIFADDGTTIPVTVLDVSNNRVTRLKLRKPMGMAVQVTWHAPGRVNKAQAGHLAKAGVEAGSVLKEFPVRPQKPRRAAEGG